MMNIPNLSIKNSSLSLRAGIVTLMSWSLLACGPTLDSTPEPVVDTTPKPQPTDLGRIYTKSHPAGIAIADEVDWYKFTVARNGYYFITTTSGLDTRGNLYLSQADNCDEYSTASGDNAGQGNNFKMLRLLETNTNYYLCVANQRLATETGNYTLNITPKAVVNRELGLDYMAGGTALHTSTKILWQQGNGGVMTQAEAVQYCQNLEVDGFSNWHLPSSANLRLVAQAYNYDKRHFTDPTSTYWSDTVYNNVGYTVNFGTAVLGLSPRTGTQFVRCMQLPQWKHLVRHPNLTIF